MIISVQYVLSSIPESLLLALLILCSLNLRVLDFLNIEARHLYNYRRYWKYLLYLLYQPYVTIQLVLNRRHQPAFGGTWVEKPRLPVPGLSIPSIASIHPALRKQLNNVGSELYICRVEFPLFRNHRQPHMLETTVYA